MILVDTSVWSAALRRPRSGELPSAGRVLKSMIERDEPVTLAGIVMQELLSGIKHEAQFQRLSRVLAPFPLLLATRSDHLRGASVLNACRSRGVHASTVDSLIVGMAIERDALLLTCDRDYVHMAEHVSFNLEFIEAV